MKSSGNIRPGMEVLVQDSETYPECSIVACNVDGRGPTVGRVVPTSNSDSTSRLHVQVSALVVLAFLALCG